jgi:23S rRNA pseudouridine1911/1915/1917 synthase
VAGNIPVLYEDDWFIIVNKPAGLLTIPSPDKSQITLTDVLNEELKTPDVGYNFHPCHRLDKETSGVIVFAKGKAAQQALMGLFAQHKVKKNYIAFVQGRLNLKNTVIDFPLENQTAVTNFKITEVRGDFTVVEVFPKTGKKNQIRLHFKMIGHPLVGESKFAFRKDFALKAKRVCLHAKQIEFLHPFNNSKVNVSCGLPIDLIKFLQKHK